jgi:hypothetical protein
VDKYRGYAQAARSLQLVPNPSPGCLQEYPQKYELSANSDNPVRLTLVSGASAPYGLVVTEQGAEMPRTILLHLNVEVPDTDQRNANMVADDILAAWFVGYEGSDEGPMEVVCSLAEEV